MTEKRKKPNCDLKQLRIINDALQKENISKEREIRRLIADLHKYEQTIVNMRSETMCNYSSQGSQKKDAEVMVGMCCARNERGEALINYGLMLHEDSVKFQERIRKMEGNLKSSGDNVRAIRRVNLALSEELHALRRVCAALDEQCRAAALRTTFKDEIIREMRRQLKQAKAKLKEAENPPTKNPGRDQNLLSEASYSSVPTAVRSQPRRTRNPVELVRPSHDSDDCRSPRLDGSGDECL